MGLLDAITGWAKSAGQQTYQNVIRSGQRGYESSRQAHGGRAPTWVAPFTGAWIEISYSGENPRGRLPSHHSRVRGLK